MVSQQLIAKLKIIFLQEYGIDLRAEEVAKMAENLVGYFDLLAKIHHRDNQINTNKNSRN